MKKNFVIVLTLITLGSASACSTAPSIVSPIRATTVIATVPPTKFALKSSEVAEGGTLPRAYTCDGSSATPPLEWRGAPTGTKSFAVVMHHIPPEITPHWYWVIYNIPPTITMLAKNAKGIGILGTNSVNNQVGFSPPCSKGPGEKIYTYTVYALSAEPQLTVLASKVNRAVLLAAIKAITLASAELNVKYSR